MLDPSLPEVQEYHKKLPEKFIRDPYVLEFLNLRSEYGESDLEELFFQLVS